MTDTLRILVVEDEPNLRRTLRVNLIARGYDVEEATDGEEALARAAVLKPDLMLLDLGLPKLDGLDVIGAFRLWSRAPVLVLTARGSEADKVAALDLGADDYLTKPFGMDELFARIRALTRRIGDTGKEPTIVETASFRVDLVDASVTLGDGTHPHLTPIEWRLLEYLARNAGRLIAQRELLQAVWGPEYGSEAGYLRVHLGHLRRKVEPDPTAPLHIVTEPGLGYRFFL